MAAVRRQRHDVSAPQQPVKQAFRERKLLGHGREHDFFQSCFAEHFGRLVVNQRHIEGDQDIAFGIFDLVADFLFGV